MCACFHNLREKMRALQSKTDVTSKEFWKPMSRHLYRAFVAKTNQSDIPIHPLSSQDLLSVPSDADTIKYATFEEIKRSIWNYNSKRTVKEHSYQLGLCKAIKCPAQSNGNDGRALFYSIKIQHLPIRCRR